MSLNNSLAHAYDLELNDTDRLRAELNIPNLNVSVSTDAGTCTFSFDESSLFELNVSEGRYANQLASEEEKELALRSDVDLVIFSGVWDPTFREENEWCHVMFPGRVSFSLMWVIKTFKHPVVCIHSFWSFILKRIFD